MSNRVLWTTFATILLLLGTTATRFSIFASSASSIINVPNDYPTVQEAIDAAYSGDTIKVQSGTYNEHVVVNKPNLTLIGENRVNTIIDGEGEGNVILLRANGSRISGFTLTHGYAGIQMSPWTQSHEITNNMITGNEFGIRGHYDVHDVTISNNTIASNVFIGLEMCFYDSKIAGNVISGNGKGEFVELSAGIEIVEGVYDETIHSDNNTVTDNIIENNFNGVLSVWYSEGNLFSHNSFENNTRSIFAGDPSTMSNNTVEENYWSDYRGQDQNGDGFGDTPYWFTAQNKDSRPLMSPYEYWSNPIVGDVNRDMKVDIADLAIAGRAFGSSPSCPRWNPSADINKDGTVDIRDLVLTAKNFGKTHA